VTGKGQKATVANVARRLNKLTSEELPEIAREIREEGQKERLQMAKKFAEEVAELTKRMDRADELNQIKHSHLIQFLRLSLWKQRWQIFRGKWRPT
jgi:hypothetical protein